MSFYAAPHAVGHPPRGGSPFPNLWGMLLMSTCMAQLACGMFIDWRYEPGIVKEAHLTPPNPAWQP